MALRFRTMAALAVTSFLVLGGILAAGAARTGDDRADPPVTAWTPMSTDWPGFHYGNDRNGLTASNATMKFAYYKWSVKTGGAVFSSPVVATAKAIGGGTIYNGPKVFVGSVDGRLYCIEGTSGRVLWRYQSGGMILMAPAVGDLEGDGNPSVVFGSNDGRVYCVNAFNGSLKWRYTARLAVIASPALADLDGDGRLEVGIGSRDGWFYVFNAEGKVLWKAALAEGNPVYPSGIQGAAAVGDLNGDGRPEIVVQTAENNLTCLAGADGKVLWEYSHLHNSTATTAISPCIADLDGDGGMEVLELGRLGNASCLDGATGELHWDHQFGGTFLSTPAIGDVDGNGKPEIVIGATGNILCLRGVDGYLDWYRRFTPNPVTNSVSMDSSPALAEIDGDGVLEIIIGGNDNMLHALNAEDGLPRWAYPVPNRVESSPAVADIDRDWKAEVVFGCDDGRVYAVDYNF